MRQLVVGTFVTLDGVMQAPGGPEEDRDGGFEHGGWSATYWDEFMGRVMDEQMRQADALLLGRRTYDIFAAHWPRVTDTADPTAAKLNSVRKYVATRSLDHASWQNTTILRGDAAKAITQLKQEAGGQIQVSGSSNLIQTLLKHDLVDEFRIWTFPLVVGPGKRLFDSGTMPRSLKLADTQVSTTGVVIQRFERVGKIQYGSFALEQ